MSKCHTRRTAARCFLLAVAVVPGAAALAADAPEEEPSLSRRRLELMEAAIRAFRVTSDESDDEAALAFAAKPLLRYNDPTRDLMDPDASGLVDATVWRLGTAGRATAIVMLEVYSSGEGAGVLAYEFVSLTSRPFTMALARDAEVAWEATGTDTRMTPIPEAPQPAAGAAGRLSQMRGLARRFAVREVLEGDEIECRLLSQPIDRYATPETGVRDGALFVFANGTNPEVGLLLECNDSAWAYGIVRMSSAATSVQLDGADVARYDFFGDYGRRDGAYTSTSHSIELPQ